MTFELLLERFGAQLGEIAWHQLILDATVHNVTNAHASRVAGVINTHINKPSGRKLRFLELGAYCHYTADVIARDFDAEVAVSDISPHALRAGRLAAREAGINKTTTMVAADFHDLPFAENYFDTVFIASAIHHTWHTSKVLNELLRITRPGGVLLIDNEPIGRELCFYQFRSNRRDSLTTWEQSLLEAGLLETISSPFGGSRPEDLFGMIENDRIPKLVFDEFLALGDILEMDMTPVMGAFEHSLAEGDPDDVEKRILERLAEPRRTFGKLERLLGFSLPSDELVRYVTMRTRPLFRELQGARNERHRQNVATALFGGALRVTLRKRDAVERGMMLEAEHGAMFRRGMALMDGVLVDLPSLPGVKVMLDNPLMPDLVVANREALQRHFVADQWLLIDAGEGPASIANVRSDQEIFFLPARPMRSSYCGSIWLRGWKSRF